ncbi:MAG TPA: HNH endonuclease signature motif containing protein, partial [Acidimicrobiia bacterium]
MSHSNPDFTGCLHVCSGHPLEMAAASRNVDRIARELKNLGNDRCLDAIRADVMLDLLQGKTIDGVTAGGGSVHLHVSVETLAMLSDRPGELAGYAPVIADIARQIALQQVDGEWTWTVTHTDQVLATGTTRYRPRAVQKRRVLAEYPTCVHPGCRQTVEQCDLDHRRPYSQGGPTHNNNLAPLCRHHHMTRHHTPWEYQRQPNGDHASRASLELCGVSVG